MNELTITRLYELVEVDTLRGLVFPRFRRRGVSFGSPMGTVSTGGYLRVRLDGRSFPLHRVIWAFAHGSWPDGHELDHRNGDRADNRLSNLRLVSRAQNSFNKRVRGYSRLPNGRFRATIGVCGRSFILGIFHTAAEARAAYEAAHAEEYGEFSPYYREVVL